jgi:hypothetical protein
MANIQEGFTESYFSVFGIFMTMEEVPVNATGIAH